MASHRVDGRKLGRKMGPRLALYKNLTVSVLRYERVRTTEAKAKEVQGRIEREHRAPCRCRDLRWKHRAASSMNPKVCTRPSLNRNLWCLRTLLQFRSLKRISRRNM